MTQYLVLPIHTVQLGGSVRVSWTIPRVGALQRILAMVENSLQARVIGSMPCAAQFAHYTMADVELARLEDPIWLQKHVRHHLVMKSGDELAVGFGPLLREAWRVKEIGMTAILRLPPSCFEPREVA